MVEEPHLDIEKTYAAVRAAARERRFIAYGDLAKASGVEWSRARRQVPQQLGQLVTIAHERGWPLLSAIVVNKEDLHGGRLEGTAREGFLSAAKMVGVKVDDPDSFIRDQQERIFSWARDAPERLGADSGTSTVGGGPRFVQYFTPVLEALRALGGKANPPDVYGWIREHEDVPADELAGVTKGGQSKFENKVGWARFYLAKAGLIDSSKRGVWVLTAEGQETRLNDDGALALFRNVHARWRSAGDEDEPPPEATAGQELFNDPTRQFWFVGAFWDNTEDQLDRFLDGGLWQNGYDDKFSEHVMRMKPGDRIAIKATFVQKYSLPFENHAKPVSAMRIKATGTITENLGDGKTVKVDWQRLDPPRDWFFYTYRVTVVQADPNEDLARRLILFTFGATKQDYTFWLTKVPSFARRYGSALEPANDADIIESEDLETEEEAATPTYTIENIALEGCFLPYQILERALLRVRTKKNLILQGPPGTGKTWLAKRLAFALMGSKDRKVTRDRLRIVQFHPSLTYEDFVRGWRPSGHGQLELVDGVFLETVQAAAAEPDRPYVLIIEEINRGNPAQIFGEMLTLLEDSKRNPEDAIELTYNGKDGGRTFIPANLHLIGTMNIADRSLALVDLALRRRFAFITLEPQLNGLWKHWCTSRYGFPEAAVGLIEQRMLALNREIEEDRSLGPQYRIGHSYVTPFESTATDNPRHWFREIAQTEIIPLLEEYWFDAPEKVRSAAGRLLDGL